MKKYELTSEIINYSGHKLHRIKALKDFSSVKAGGLGGWIESEENLSQDGTAWVFDNVKVYEKAIVSGNAEIHNTACIFDNAKVCGDAKVCNNAWVFGNASVCDNAEIYNITDYIVFKNFWSSGRCFTWTRSNNMWKVGCFYGTSKELIKKVYADSEKSGKEYERVVRYVESILADEK